LYTVPHPSTSLLQWYHHGLSVFDTQLDSYKLPAILASGHCS